MKNDIFDITWVAEDKGNKLKISFRLENNDCIANFDVNGETDVFNEGRMCFIEGIQSYLLAYEFVKGEYCIKGTVVDSLTFVPSNVNFPGNIALSEDARLYLYIESEKRNIEFKKHVKKMIKLSEIARVEIGKKLTPVQGGLAMYIRDWNFDRNIRVNHCMVDNEHAVFIGISKENIDFFTDCDDNSGRYCASENIAVLTNIQHRFDKPWIQYELREQIEKILKEKGQQVLTLEQVKNLVLDDEKYQMRKFRFEGLDGTGEFELIM